MSAPVVYDRDADVLYVRLKDVPVATTSWLDDLRAIDYSDDGAIVGVEFIDASTGVDLTDVPFAREIERLIGESGQPVKLFA